MGSWEVNGRRRSPRPAPKTKALFTARIYGLIERGAIGSSPLYDELLRLFGPHNRIFLMTETERRILAAQGYVELSLYAEARVELTKLPEEAGGRVDVLEILLLCLMAESQWAEALALTMRLCELEPEEPGGFIHAAFCLHELGRTNEAVDMLSRGPTALRSKPVFYYNMGCYYARLGDSERALKLLRQSFEMDGSLRAVARKDPDLDGLRPALQRL